MKAGMSLIESILVVADAYCRGARLSRARVSTIVFNDGKKLDLIAGGADLNTRRYEMALQWFSDHWPEACEWPDDVHRPEPVVAEAAS